MTIELRWLASASASTLHAAAAMLEGWPLVDRATGGALAGEVAELARDLETLALTPARFFDHAIGASTRLDNPARLAEVVIAKLHGPRAATEAAPALARRLIGLQTAFLSANPAVVDELETRSGPLREQWEARGPGLLAAIRRLTEPELVTETADAMLVHPVLGGGGAAHVLYNSVRIEAVLTNPLAELPEVVRLGWMLAQLNLDLGRFGDHLPADRLAVIGPLAMIPPAVAAAEEVELARFQPGTIAAALSGWRTPAANPATLLAWWETYQSSRPPWTVALAALDQMLASEPAADGSDQGVVG
jgi:hypothetical protein